jgi:hypothetical protein
MRGTGGGRLGAHALIAWQGVRRRPLRNILTAISLLIGVLSIVLIQGAGAQMSDAIVRDAVLTNGGKTTMLVPILATAGTDRSETAREWKQSLTRITSDSGGVVATFMQDSKARVYSAGNEIPGIAVLMVDPALREIRPFPVERGQWFRTPTIGPQLVVNEAAWRQGPWQDGAVELTRDGTYDRYRARLIGVVDDGSSEAQGYVSLAGGAWGEPAYRSGTVSLLVHSESLGAATLHSRITTLAETAGRKDQIGDLRRLDTVDDYTDQLRTSRRIFLGVASLSLLVGSMGILNIGLATVRERSEELSLRRSFGATRGHVVQIMILESQIVALAAAALAIGVAALVVPAVLPHLAADRPLASAGLPVSAMLAGLTASCVSALVGALAPAVRAARVPIASIMR